MYDALSELNEEDLKLLYDIEHEEIELCDIYRDIDLYRSFRKLKQLNLLYTIEHISLNADAYLIIRDLEM